MFGFVDFFVKLFALNFGAGVPIPFAGEHKPVAEFLGEARGFSRGVGVAFGSNEESTPDPTDGEEDCGDQGEHCWP